MSALAVDYVNETDLEGAGITVPTDQVIRSASWVALMGQTDRLVDLLARDWFESKLALIPADTATATGDLAARLCRSLARSAVARARKHAHDWESYADGLTAASRTTFADDWSQCWEDEVNAQRPTPSQVIAASVDPMRRARWSDRLQARGTQLIQQIDGDKGLRPDVYDPDLFRYIARPDPIAHCAEVRYVNPQPCRYGRNGNQPASVTIPRRQWVTCEVMGEQAIAERLTTLTDLTSERKAMLLARLSTLTLEGFDRSRIGWRGHRLVSWELAQRVSKVKTSAPKQAKRKAVKTARIEAGATGKRGRTRTAWSLSERSLTRAIARTFEQDLNLFAERWTAVQSTLAMAAAGQVVTFNDGRTIVTVLSGAQVMDDKRGRAYPIGEWSKRYVLAQRIPA